MAGVPRESSFMPTIKCAECGNDVEISMMGDHLCSGAAAAAPPPEPAPAAAAPAPAAPAAKAGGGGFFGGLLGGGGLIDTFMPLGKSVHDKIGAIPPVDTDIASESPATPAPQLHDTDTSPSDRSYSRQPLTPMSLSSGSRSVSPRTPGARPSIGRADDYFTPQIANEDQSMPQPRRPGGYGGFADAEPEPAYPATSPKNAGPSLLTRIGSIAAGPYGSEPDSPPPMPKANASRRLLDDPPRPAPAPPSGGMGPPRRPKNNGYGGFGPPRGEDRLDAFASPTRAQTFEIAATETYEPAPYRAPSAPGPRPDRLRDTSRPPPPRTSLVRTGIKNPSINLEAEFGSGNPYHSPSPSTASSMSRGSSHTSQPSSVTSPARSATSTRKPSDMSAFDNLMNDVQASMDDMKMRDYPPTPEMPKAMSPGMQGPPMGDRYDPAVQGGRPPSPPPSRWDRDDRQDPAVQGSGQPRRQKDLPPSPTEARPPTRSRTPGLPNSRGNCKACGLAITGKSISSADGRLTGRYHKACFVCMTCSEPFPTAEFYVHDDRPYCQRHYHKMNGSLCGSCRDGIEGQYLEDESTKKYHVACFRCGDCQNVLRDGYYEVDGRAFCERDAWRRIQQTQRRSPSMSSQRSYGSSSNLAPPGGRPGMRPPPGGLPGRPGMPMGNGRMGPPMPKGPGMGLNPSMPRMEKRRTRLGMM